MTIGQSASFALALLAAFEVAAAAADDLTSTPPSTSAPARGSLEIVVVTAEKRAEDLQAVPQAVTAFTANDRVRLGVFSIQDFTNFTPGLTYNGETDRAYIRGIGRQFNRLSTDSGVAIYSDGFFTTSVATLGEAPLFVDRVEVLRGPQGTLYGRNAIGGAINTISARPTPEPYAEIRANIDDHTAGAVETAWAGPITDRIRFRVQGSFYGQGKGYFRNVATGGRGSSDGWYGNAQLDIDTSAHSELWLKFEAAASSSWNDGTATGSYTLAPYDTTLCSFGGCGLFFNANYGYNVFDPQSGGAVGHTQLGNVTQNPQLTDIHSINGGPQNGPNPTVRDFYNLNAVYTHHFNGFDVKYLAGYTQYVYRSPSESANVTSVTFPLNPGSTCAFVAANPVFWALFPDSRAAPGACGPVTLLTGGHFEYDEFNSWQSHEIDVTSTTDGRLQWIAGAYAFDEHYRNPEDSTGNDPALFDPIDVRGFAGGSFVTVANPAGSQYDFDYGGHTRSLAGFGQIDWNITPAIKLTGGVRYTGDHKSGTEMFREICYSPTCAGGDPRDLGTLLSAQALDTTALTAASFPSEDAASHVRGVTTPARFDPVVAALTGSGWVDYTLDAASGHAVRRVADDWSGVTGTGGVQWTADDETNLYLRYSRGYKSGGFNLGELQANPEVAPEHADAWELGFKKGFGTELVVDAALYHSKYKGMQIGVTEFVANVFQGVSVNVPAAISEGIEIETVWAPLEHLSFLASYSFDDARVTSGCRNESGTAVGFCLQDPIDPDAQDPQAHPVPGLPSGVQDVAGARLPNTPRNKLALNASYAWVIEEGSLTASANYEWRDRTWESLFTRSYDMAPSCSKVDLRLIWSGNDGKYTVIGSVTNLFNALTYPNANSGLREAPDATMPASFRNYGNYSIGAPRAFDLALYYRVY